MASLHFVFIVSKTLLWKHYHLLNIAWKISTLLWAVKKNKYSVCSSKLQMNGSVTGSTLQYYFIKNLTHYLRICLTQCNTGSYINSFRTPEDTISSSKPLFFQLLQYVTLTKMLPAESNLNWFSPFCFNVNKS